MYCTDLEKTQWQVIKKILNLQKGNENILHEIWNATFYLVRTGYQWRMLPCLPFHIRILFILPRFFFKRVSLVVKNRLFHICAFVLHLLCLPMEKRNFFPITVLFLHNDRLYRHEKGLHCHEDGRRYP